MSLGVAVSLGFVFAEAISYSYVQKAQCGTVALLQILKSIFDICKILRRMSCVLAERHNPHASNTLTDAHVRTM